MSEFKVFKATPPKTSSSGKPKYPFNTMNVGDAFDAPRDDETTVRNSAYQYGKRHGVVFSARRISADTVRVYRIA